jgi:hypothetical protein
MGHRTLKRSRREKFRYRRLNKKRTRRRYRGAPPSHLRKSVSAKPLGLPPDPSSHEQVVFIPKREAKPGFQFPVSGHNTFVVERANKMYPGQKPETHKERKEREAAEEEAKRKALEKKAKAAKKREKANKEGFGPSSTRGRFNVSEKISSLESFAEEEE